MSDRNRKHPQGASRGGVPSVASRASAPTVAPKSRGRGTNTNRVPSSSPAADRSRSPAGDSARSSRTVVSGRLAKWQKVHPLPSEEESRLDIEASPLARSDPRALKCGWCGSKATMSSTEGGELDQCNNHHEFHKKVLSTIRWDRLVAIYHSSDEEKAAFDEMAKKFLDGVNMLFDKGSPEDVSRALKLTSESYIKFSLVSPAHLQQLFDEAKVQVTEKSLIAYTAGIPLALVAAPGTADKEPFYFFPRCKQRPWYPVLKISSSEAGHKSSPVLQATQKVYEKHATHALSNVYQDIIEESQLGELVSTGQCTTTIDDLLDYLGGGPKPKAAKEAAESPIPKKDAKRPCDVETIALNLRGAARKKRTPQKSVREILDNLSSKDDVGCASPPPATSAQKPMVDFDWSDVEEDDNGEVLVPNSVKAIDDEQPDSDADNEAVRLDLRKNYLRADLYGQAKFGKKGNERWQCERAARHWTKNKRGDVASHLETWASKARKCEGLCPMLVYQSNPQERREAINILIEEYGSIPPEVKPRLVMAEGMNLLSTTVDQFDKVLDVTFPWCAPACPGPFLPESPTNVALDLDPEKKAKVFKNVVFIGFLKHKIVGKENGTVAAEVSQKILSRCESLLSQRSFKPTPREFDILKDIITACRCVLCVVRPGLLADSLYVDALDAGAAFRKSTSIGKTFVNAVGNWIGASVELKSWMDGTMSKIEALRQTARKAEASKEEIDEAMVDENDCTFDDLRAYFEAVKSALKTVSYSVGAKVGKSTESFREALPEHMCRLMNASKHVMTLEDQDPTAVVDMLAEIISESTVVLPHDKKIAELESELAQMQRQTLVKSQTHDWSMVCKAVAQQVTVDSLKALDVASEKYSGAQFRDVQNLVAHATDCLHAVVAHALDTFPAPGLREDLAGLVSTMSPFLTGEPENSTLLQSVDKVVTFVSTGVEVKKMADVVRSMKDHIATFEENVACQRKVLSCQASLRKFREATQHDIVNLMPESGTPHSKKAAREASLLLEETDNLMSDSIKCLRAAIYATLQQSYGVIDKAKFGMDDGGSYRDKLPKSNKPSWKSYKTAIEESLGKSEVAASLDVTMKNAKQVMDFWQDFLHSFGLDDDPMFGDLSTAYRHCAMTWCTAMSVYIINTESDKTERRSKLMAELEALAAAGVEESSLDKVLHEQITKNCRI